MSVENELEEIAKEKFGDMSYIFDDWNSADRGLEKVQLPAILNILPVSGAFKIKNGRMKDEPNCLIAFLDKVKKDADGDDNEEVYTRMKRKAMEFVKGMNESGKFEPIEGEIPYSVIHEQMSCVVTGVALTLTVKEVEGGCV